MQGAHRRTGQYDGYRQILWALRIRAGRQQHLDDRRSAQPSRRVQRREPPTPFVLTAAPAPRQGLVAAPAGDRLARSTRDTSLPAVTFSGVCKLRGIFVVIPCRYI